VKNRLLQTAIFLLWGICIFLGLMVLAQHQNTPGEPLRPAGEASVEKAVASLPRPDLAAFLAPEKEYTLVLLAHPRCPCTRASLHELRALLPRLEGKVAVRSYFILPEGEGPEFAAGENLDLARDIPGMRASILPAAEILPKLGAGTSGQVLVFNNRAARLEFQGGITAGRGHEGRNAGTESIATLIKTGQTPLRNTPVYGCSLAGAPATQS
jgi:hypothetical protein